MVRKRKGIRTIIPVWWGESSRIATDFSTPPPPIFTNSAEPEEEKFQPKSCWDDASKMMKSPYALITTNDSAHHFPR